MSPSSDAELATDRPDDTSDASPIFGTVMVLWFLAFGIGAGYLAVTRYIGGWPLLSMQVLGFAGAMVVNFIVVGAVVKMITWRSPTVPEDAPWKLRPSWQSSTIEEDLYFRTVSPWSAALFGVAGWGTGGGILYFNYWLPENPDSGVLLFLVFPIAFSVPAVLTLRRVWHRRKYGTSTLAMDTMPARPGKTLEARLQTSVVPSDAHGDALQVQLTCYRRSSGGDDTSSWFQKWQSETDVAEYFSSVSQSGPTADDRVEVPISFDLPADAPPSTPEKKSNRIAWVLEASAEMNGLDYQSYFEIPVFEPEAPASTQAPAASQASSTDPVSLDEQVTSEEPTSPQKPSVAPSHSDRSPSSQERDRKQSAPSPNPSFGEPSTDLSGDEKDQTDDKRADEETVRCNNCYSTVKGSAAVCPACGADLESGWFS